MVLSRGFTNDNRLLKKGSECFESLSMNGKILNDIKTPPFVTSINSVQALSFVEGLRRSFAAACYRNLIRKNVGRIERKIPRTDAPMKKICRILLAMLSFTFLYGTHGFSQDKIRMGLSSVSALHSAVWVAEQKGLFRKHGLDTEIIVTGQGATVGIGGLLANDIQIASAGGDSLVNAALRGGETVMIAAVVNQGLNRILARPDIKTPADLKGRKIGVTRIGAISHSVLLMMLKRWNMSPTDLQVLQLGSSPNMLAALDKGGIDAAVMTIPFVFVAEDRGFRVLVDLAETDIYYLHTMIASTRSYIRANHDKVVEFS